MYKKIILTIILFTISSTTALAWDDCPKGLVDEPYPGECSKYVDTDNDGICDHSQLAPEDREIEVERNGYSENPEEVVQTNSAEKNGNIDRILLAALIVIIHLVAILIYVNYKKRKNV
jgi:hypothetical protein